MKAGRQVVVREWCEWHLICTATVRQACMTMRMQRNSCQNASCIVWKICFDVENQIDGNEKRY